MLIALVRATAGRWTILIKNPFSKLPRRSVRQYIPRERETLARKTRRDERTLFNRVIYQRLICEDLCLSHVARPPPLQQFQVFVAKQWTLHRTSAYFYICLSSLFPFWYSSRFVLSFFFFFFFFVFLFSPACHVATHFPHWRGTHAAARCGNSSGEINIAPRCRSFVNCRLESIISWLTGKRTGAGQRQRKRERERERERE